MKELAQFQQRLVGQIAPAQPLVDHGLGDGGSGQIEPFTQLFLEQAEEAGGKRLHALRAGGRGRASEVLSSLRECVGRLRAGGAASGYSPAIPAADVRLTARATPRPERPA